MPLANAQILKAATQAYRIRAVAGSPFAFSISDVNSDGTDSGAGRTYPPAGDPVIITDADLDSVAAFGAISGSIEAGGMSGSIDVLNTSPGTFDEDASIELWISTLYGMAIGVVGAAGIADEARIFQGHVADANVRRNVDGTGLSFALRSPVEYLKRASISRGIDWAAGLGHSAPSSYNNLMDHVVRAHTNWASRYNFGIYLDDHEVDTYSSQAGSTYDILKNLTNNAVEGWVFCRREGDLFIGCHPNLNPTGHAIFLNDPKVELTDDLVWEWRIPEASIRQVASVLVTATTSDNTELTAEYFTGTIGSHDRVGPLRYDDQDTINYLAHRLALHRNRKYRAVEVDLGLMVAVDLGDCVLCSLDDSTRDIHWFQKLFVVTGITYNIDTSAESFRTTLVLDEVIP